MVVEPIAGDPIEDNLNPVGRAYYGFSTLLCTPSSLPRTSGWRSAPRPARPASATSHRRGVHPVPDGAQTPFNNVFEVRK